MADHKDLYTIERMSRVFGVSRSGYYRWLNSEPSSRTKENHQLKKRIHQIWLDSRKKYGSPRIHRQLLRDGSKVSRPRVARLMQKMGIASKIRRKWVVTTDSRHNHPVAPNLLGRRFTTTQIGEVFVSDITYIPSRDGWLYLTTVMDLADRQIVGWSFSNSMDAKSTSIEALKMARKRRTLAEEAIFHSDRGVQYACQSFVNELSATGNVRQSMSRKGNCWDNAAAESFFKTLKAELDMDEPFETYQQARAAIFEFIEIWYNRKRLHSALDYQTPAEMEQLLLTQKQAA